MFKKKWEIFDTITQEVCEDRFRKRSNAVKYAETLNYFEEFDYNAMHPDHQAVIGPPGEVYVVRRISA